MSSLEESLARLNSFAQAASGIQREGRVTRLVGLTLEASGCPLPIGSRCEVLADGQNIETEVVGFAQDKTYLMCMAHTQGIAPGAKIRPCDSIAAVPVGQALLGRILDGAGQPIDQGPALDCTQTYPLISAPINPLRRHPIDQPMDVGVKAINGLLTIGQGQRIGLFSGSGVGKSVLLSMMTRFSQADIVVVGLIGERGREVKEFIERNLGTSGLAKSVIVAAAADESPLMRLHGAMTATAIAEYFRDQGKNVLLLMDSLTRFAQAGREIGLSIGEPPTTKGYPPSVFTKLPQLVERAGNAELGGGSITAFYTVLTEGDDQQDPIADAARAILDGHIVLNRELAEAGHFPAIDIEASISRVMPNVVNKDQYQTAIELKKIYSAYQRNKDLITVGAYARGSDPMIDFAIELKPIIDNFLQQAIDEPVNFTQTLQILTQLVEQTHGQATTSG